MNAPFSPAGLLPASHESLPETAEDEAAFTLRRTGLRPLRFTGWQVIEAKGCSQAPETWHDLNIYRTVKGRIVVDLIARRSRAEQQDVFRVESFDTMEAAATWLQAFRAADDAPIPAGMGAAETALPWAVLQAVQLRQQIDRIDSDYRALLSEVFMALDLCESVDDAPAMPA